MDHFKQRVQLIMNEGFIEDGNLREPEKPTNSVDVGFVYPPGVYVYYSYVDHGADKLLTMYKYRPTNNPPTVDFPTVDFVACKVRGRTDEC